MQEYVQKSTRTTFPRSSLIVSGLLLSHSLIARKRRGRSEVGQLRRLRAHVRGAGDAAAGVRQVAQLSFRDARAFDRLLERVGVVGEPGLEPRVDVEDDRQCRQRDGDPERGTHFLGARPQEALAAHRDHEHRYRRTERVGERQQHCPPAEVERRRLHGDRGEHRPGAGHEHEPEAEAEQESAAEVAARGAREPLERPLDQHADLRDDQADRDHEQHRDRDVPQQVFRQPELVEHPRGEEREDGEADHQAGDDRERLSPSARRATREQDRQHR